MEEGMQTTQTAEAPLAVKIISLFGIIIGLIGIIFFGLGRAWEGGFSPLVLVISGGLIWSSFGIRKMKIGALWVFTILASLTLLGLIIPLVKILVATPTEYSVAAGFAVVVLMINNQSFLSSVRSQKVFLKNIFKP